MVTPIRKQAVLAKLTRPKLVAAVTRERLFALIDDRLAHPAVWVTAPPGAGKTTLVSGYVESRQRPALWYQLDRGDTDIATFFYYVGVATQSLAVGEQAEPLPALTPEYLPDLAGFARRFFRELFARLPADAVLVLDDYQEVPQDSLLHGVLASALAELPYGVRCVMASRVEPPPVLSRLLAYQTIVTLDWQDLRLTSDEAESIAHARNITDATLISASHRRSDGWMAGLILLLGQSAMDPVDAPPALARTPRVLFNYFAEFFSNVLPAETRHLLLRTAFLPNITGGLATRLSANPRADLLLRGLHEANFFIDRRAESEPTYRLHALFHEFLREYASRMCTAAERLQQLRDTASALADSGRQEDAAVLYCEAEDWDAAATLVIAIAPVLMAQGRWQTLQGQIAALPGSLIESMPWLRYWLGESQMASDIHAARANLTRACEGFAAAGDDVGQMLAAATVIEIHQVVFGDFTALDRWIDVLDRAFAKAMPITDQAVELKVLSILVVALAYRAPSHENLAAHAARLLELAASDADPTQRIVAGGVLCWYLSWIGDQEGARHARAIAMPLLDQAQVLPMRKAWVLTGMAFAAHMCADAQDSDAIFARAFAITQEHGLAHIEFWMRVGECWHRLVRGEYEAVGTILKEHESALIPTRYLDVSQFRFVKAWLALLGGDFPLARQEGESALDLAMRSGAIYGESFALLLTAKAHIELQQHDEAADYIARFHARFDRVHGPMFRFHVLLVEAFAALARHDDSKCAMALRAAFLIGRSHGYVTTLFWYHHMMSRLCGFALERGIETNYVRMLVVRRRLTTDVPLEAWPWPVKIHVLGGFKIHAHDDELRFEGKAQRKPIELLKVLVALGGRDVPADTLIDILWPEPGQGDGQKALDITVHRLRKLLGHDDAIRVTDRRATLDPQIVWVDAWALEHTLGPWPPAADVAEAALESLEAVAPSVLRLYRGHVLADEVDKSWSLALRNRLAVRFQRFALRLGEHWEAHQRWRDAIALYQRAVEIEPLAESFYRRQMISLQALGQRAEAIEVYRRCRQTLSVTLGIAPSEETDAVYRQLRDEICNP